jgi:archaeosine synthase beta-subunit
VPLRSLTLSLRKDVLARRIQQPIGYFQTARFYEADHYRFQGISYHRIRIILRSNGCSQPTCTMCPLPNEGIPISKYRIQANDYVMQVRSVLKSHSPCEMLCVYNDGSFFSTQELPTVARQQIYQLACEYNCRVLMVESLPVFINSAVLAEARASLKNIKLVVGMGLQSFDDTVRDLCIASPVQLESFLKACNTLRAFDCGIKVYLLLKPPFLTEDEAILDCITSVHKLRHFYIDDVTICPLRVGRGTVAERLQTLGMYRPPALSSLAEVLRRIPGDSRARVSIFNVNSSDIPTTTPITCEHCLNPILHALTEYNNDPVATNLTDVHCDHCEKEARKYDCAFRDCSLEQRLQLYFQKNGHSHSE